MPATQLKTLLSPSANSSAIKVKKATIASVSNQPKVSTEQALRGYNYLKVHSSRSR